MERMEKICKGCGRELPLSAFNKDKSRSDGHRTRCRECDAAHFQKRYNDPAWREVYSQRAKNWRLKLKSENPTTLWALDTVSNARQRAKRAGLMCTIDVDHIRSLVVDTCPLLGLPLVYSADELRSNTATLDRKHPHKGYVPGNVAVVSHRANRLKSDSSVEELQLLLNNLIDYMASA